ncbi:MAG: sulfite exporter TauE/SafE family protein [Acidimicrobiia bacterium]|jgi:hypothetical protein
MSATPSRAIILGLVAGTLAGLLGIGGGIVIIPGLVLWLGFGQHEASGTSITTVIATSAAALISFAFDGSVDWHAAALIAIGALTGASIGTRILHLIPAKVLTKAFSVVAIIAAVRMAL